MIDDIFTVLQNVDSETGILTTPFPVGIYEPNPVKIIDSLGEYLINESLMNGDGANGKTTCLARKEANEYDSFYKIYHDIKVSCSINIRTLKVGSDKYNKIDFFYKLASELLIRESSLLKMTLLSFKEEPTMASELEEQISADFDKISYYYGSSNGEVITHISEIPDPNASNLNTSYLYTNTNPTPSTIKQPLFTSSTGKSELDPRLTIVPEPYSLAKTVPLPRNSGSNGSTFESLNTQVSKIPLPTNNPTTMLDNFVFITWYIINAPEWLTYKGKLLKPPISSKLFRSKDDDFKFVTTNNESARSFAPTVDSKGAGVSAILKSNIWLNQVGLKKIQAIRNEYLKNIGKGNAESNKESKEGSDNKNQDKDDKKAEETVDKPSNNENSKDSETELAEYDEAKEIDVAQLLRWDPSDVEELEVIKKEKDTILGSAQNFQRIITKEILALNKLRQERYLRSSPNNIMGPTMSERKLYKKITKLISLAVSLYNITPSKLPVEFSKRIPVLMSEYSGTLPGLPASKAKSAKLTNTRGSYRKKR